MIEEYVLDESKLCIKVINTITNYNQGGCVRVSTPDDKFSRMVFIPKNLFFTKSLSERCEIAIADAKDKIRNDVKIHNTTIYLNNKYGTCKEKETPKTDERTCIRCGQLTYSDGEYCVWCGTKER